MSDVMLLGVLEMPIELWRDDPMDQYQRHSRYIEAATRIRDDEAEIIGLRAELAELQTQIDALQSKVHLCAGYDAMEGDVAGLRGLLARARPVIEDCLDQSPQTPYDLIDALLAEIDAALAKQEGS